MPEKPIVIATRGSALALAQANMIAAAEKRLDPALPVLQGLIDSILAWSSTPGILLTARLIPCHG